jgi:diguanylate cyclase (GGDEF)-like protein
MKLKNIFSLLNTITVLIMLVLFTLLSIAVKNTNEEIEWVVHTHDVIIQAENLMSNMIDQETGMRGFLATGNEQYLEPYNEAFNKFDSQMNLLKITVDDNPSQVAQLTKIAHLANLWHVEAADNYLSIKREIIDSDVKMLELYGLSNSGIDKEKMDKIRKLLSNIDNENVHLNILVSMINMETGVRAYIINKDVKFLEPYYEGLEKVRKDIENLNNLEITIAINDWIKSVAEKQIALVDEALEYKTEEDLFEEISKGNGKRIMDQIRDEVDHFIRVEEDLLIERSIRLNNLQQASLIAISISVVMAILIGFIQYIAIRRITNPLVSLTKHMKNFDPEDFEQDIVVSSGAVVEIKELAGGYTTLLNELKASQKELHGLTRTDQLTGVKNKRWFDENIELEWERCMESEKHLTILMIDIDFFKHYNDNFGHVEGDKCLKRVANSIQKCLRHPMDSVSRFGGEEFVVILPETDSDGGLVVAEIIRNSIEELEIENTVHGQLRYLSVSIGIASIIPRDEASINNLIDSSDKAMYKAKDRGRNTCSVYKEY